MEKTNRVTALRNLSSLIPRTKEEEIKVLRTTNLLLWQALSSFAGRMEASGGNLDKQNSAIAEFQREVRVLRPPQHKKLL